jgi:hypothetical protein
VDRYERTPEGSPNRLTVRRKPRDHAVLKMLSPHFSRTYGDKLQHQHSGIISVMPAVVALLRQDATELAADT